MYIPVNYNSINMSLFPYAYNTISKLVTIVIDFPQNCYMDYLFAIHSAYGLFWFLEAEREGLKLTMPHTHTHTHTHKVHDV